MLQAQALALCPLLSRLWCLSLGPNCGMDNSSLLRTVNAQERPGLYTLGAKDFLHLLITTKLHTDTANTPQEPNHLLLPPVNATRPRVSNTLQR